jgi:hypothetical protein
MRKVTKAIEAFKAIIEDLKSDLSDALVSADIWHIKDAQSLGGYNVQHKATALFNEVTRMLEKTLSSSDFPNLGDYYMVHTSNGYLVVINKAGDYQLGMTVDLSKTTMGILMSIVLPKIQEDLKNATQ